MASTRNLQASAAWVLPMLGYQPITITGDEPAISAANLTKQMLMAPPFRWPWNRVTVSINLIPPSAQGVLPAVAGQQDYAVMLSDFGYLERATVTDTKGAVKPVELKQQIDPESAVQRPASVAFQTDDNAGTYTVRLNAIPDQAYKLTLVYQRKPVLLSSMAATWAPIPDELMYVYDWLFLAHCCLVNKDPRFPIFFQRGISHLLSRAEGLDELDRNLFLGNWLQVLTAPSTAQTKAQQGLQARGM